MAISNRIRNGIKLPSLGQNPIGVHATPSFIESHPIRMHQPQIKKPKIRHRPRRRPYI
jgi:hypothetical protein